MPAASRPDWRSAVLVAGVALVAFSAALCNAFLGDDHWLVFTRLADRGLSDLPRLFGESYWQMADAVVFYRPLALALIGLERLAFGVEPSGFHAVSLGLHAAASLLVLRLFWHWLAPAPAALGAAIFAAHPVHAEAVTTVYGQSDLLAALPFLAALERVSAWRERPGRRAGWLGVYTLYLASLLCKESGVLLPMAAALARGLGAPGERGWRRWLSWREAGFAFPLVAFLCLRFAILGEAALPGAGAVATERAASVYWAYPWWARVNLVVVTLGESLRLLLLPTGQTTYYGHLRDAIFGQPLRQGLWLVGSAALLGAVVRRLRSPAVAFALGLLAVTLLPVANLLPLGAPVAERTLYLPSVAVALLAGAVVEAALERRRALTLAVAAALVLLGTAQSLRVAWSWRTPLAHWQATLEAHPRSPMAHALVGRLLMANAASRGTPPPEASELVQRAERHLRRALELNPASSDAWRGLGLLALLRGQRAEGCGWLARALDARPDDPEIAAEYEACR
jgi:hypothetical protein